MLGMYMNYFKAKFGNKRGQGMVEYGLIIALVAIALIVSIGLMKDQLLATFTNITTKLSGANTPST